MDVTIEGGGQTIHTTTEAIETAGKAARAGVAGFSQGQLRAFVERIERLEEEKATVADDIKEVYAEAKANGFDTKTMRQVVRLRRQDAAERAEQEALLDLYLHALGMRVVDEDVAA